MVVETLKDTPPRVPAEADPLQRSVTLSQELLGTGVSPVAALQASLYPTVAVAGPYPSPALRKLLRIINTVANSS